MAREPASLLDFDRRLAAVQTFARLEQAESLAAANKRIANILRKAGDPTSLQVNKKLLQEDAEVALASALSAAQEKLKPLLAVQSYADILNELADLRDPVDRFFDDVAVDDACASDGDDLTAAQLSSSANLAALAMTHGTSSAGRTRACCCGARWPAGGWSP